MLGYRAQNVLHGLAPGLSAQIEQREPVRCRGALQKGLLNGTAQRMGATLPAAAIAKSFQYLTVVGDEDNETLVFASKH
jgi:hypothetical protein